MPAPYGQRSMPPRTRRPGRERSKWHWLLAIPVVLPLLTPLYDRAEPQLWGIPFFYWVQLGGILLAMVIIALVYQVTRVRD